MDYISRNLAINLKRIRQARRMTLDDVAEQTGVSKSMLGQIERYESNPTISTIGKIVSGLRVTINDLVESPDYDTYYVKKSKLTPSKEIAGEYSVTNYFPFEKNRKFEIYTFEILPNGKYFSGSHGEKTSEYIIVTEGTLTLKVGNEVHEISVGDAIRFSTDKDHEYINYSNNLMKCICFFNFN